MAWPLIAAAAAGALAGGLLGQKPKTSSQNSTEMSWMDLAPESAYSQHGRATAFDQFKDLRGLLGQGPGESDYTRGFESQRGLADLFGRGFLPTQSDTDFSRDFAQQQFAPRRLDMFNAFEDQRLDSARQAARLGRRSSDPTLQGILRKSQLLQQNQMSAEQNQFANAFAMQMPQQRLNFEQQRTGILSQLGNQAQQNRMTLLGLGQDIFKNEDQFRIATAYRHGQGGGSTYQPGPGFLAGSLQGVSSALGIASMFGGGGGGATAGGASQVASTGGGQGYYSPQYSNQGYSR